MQSSSPFFLPAQLRLFGALGRGWHGPAGLQVFCPSHTRGLYRSGDGWQEPLEEEGTKLLFPRCLVGAVSRLQQSSMVAVGDHESVEKLMNWFVWLLFARSYLGGVKVQRERCMYGCDQVCHCSPVGVVRWMRPIRVLQLMVSFTVGSDAVHVDWSHLHG